MREEGLRGRRLSSQERMAQDQTSNRSAVIKQRWMRWMDQHDLEGGVAPSGAQPTTRANVLALTLLAVTIGLVMARLLL